LWCASEPLGEELTDAALAPFDGRMDPTPPDDFVAIAVEAHAEWIARTVISEGEQGLSKIGPPRVEVR